MGEFISSVRTTFSRANSPSQNKREVNSKLFLKTLKSNIINESSNILHSFGSNREISRSVTVELTNSKITNLVQFTLKRMKFVKFCI